MFHNYQAWIENNLPRPTDRDLNNVYYKPIQQLL